MTPEPVVGICTFEEAREAFENTEKTGIIIQGPARDHKKTWGGFSSQEKKPIQY